MTQPDATLTFTLVRANSRAAGDYHNVVMHAHDGVTGSSTAIGDVFHNQELKQFWGCLDGRATRHVADPRTAFDDVVKAFLNPEEHRAVEAAYRITARLKAEFLREYERVEQRDAESEDAKRDPMRARRVYRSRNQLDGALAVLAQILAIVGEDVIAYKAPSHELAENRLDEWIKRNPSG